MLDLSWRDDDDANDILIKTISPDQSKPLYSNCYNKQKCYLDFIISKFHVVKKIFLEYDSHDYNLDNYNDKIKLLNLYYSIQVGNITHKKGTFFCTVLMSLINNVPHEELMLYYNKHGSFDSDMRVSLLIDKDIKYLDFKLIIHYTEKQYTITKELYHIDSNILSYYSEVIKEKAYYINMIPHCLILQYFYKSESVDYDYPVITNVIVTYDNDTLCNCDHETIIKFNIYDQNIYLIPVTKEFSTVENIVSFMNNDITPDKFSLCSQRFHRLKLDITYEDDYNNNLYIMNVQYVTIGKTI